MKVDFDKNTIKKLHNHVRAGWLVYKDKNGVYFTEDDTLYLIHTIEDADLDTFKVLSTSPTMYYDSYIGIHAKDKNALYTVDRDDNVRRFDGVDIDSFEIIETKGEGFEYIRIYSKDKNNVYDGNFNTIEWADPETFEVWGLDLAYEEEFMYGFNKNDLWFYSDARKEEVIVEGVDSQTFEIVESFFTIRDKSLATKYHVVLSEEKCKDIPRKQDEYIEYNSPYLDLSDIDNFEYRPMEEGGCEIFYRELLNEPQKDYFYAYIVKDKNYVWIYDKFDDSFTKLSELDAETFVSLKDDFGVFKDKNNVYYVKESVMTLIPDLNPEEVKIEVGEDGLFLIDEDVTLEFDRDKNEFIKTTTY